jgi:hypothetical protein
MAVYQYLSFHTLKRILRLLILFWCCSILWMCTVLLMFQRCIMSLSFDPEAAGSTPPKCWQHHPQWLEKTTQEQKYHK